MQKAVERFAIDLHLHTRRYSPCAELVPPEEIASSARRAGLSGVVLTDHDVLWSIEETKELREIITYKAICPGTGEELE